MENSIAIRRKLNSYLFLTSGIQMICALFYDYDIAWGSEDWKINVGEELYPTFKYGCLSLFLNGLLYHCLSKPLYRGTSGFPFQYVAVLLNLNQICSIVSFFYPLFKWNPRNGFTIFQLFVYLPTSAIGVLLNYFAWNQITPKNITLTGSFVLSRRRDWGIAGTLLSACQLVLIFWNSIKCFYEKNYYVRDQYGDKFKFYEAGMFLMVVGALGYHVLGMKVSKGVMPCHRKLNIVSLSFAIIELFGLAIYVYASSATNNTKIFYYHSLIFSLGMCIAAFGNSYISRKKFDDDVTAFESSNYFTV